MSDTIQDGKYVELTYKVVDEKTGGVLIAVEYPIGYVHGANDLLAPAVVDELEGRGRGDVIAVPIDCNLLYGPRDESLVFTDAIENVPEEFREIGTTIVTENEKGETRNFIVTRMDDKNLTVDGNNPLSGRQVVFELTVLAVRDATAAEIEAGGTIEARPDIDEKLTIPI